MQPTPDGRRCSAFAVHIINPAWLTLLVKPISSVNLSNHDLYVVAAGVGVALVVLVGFSFWSRRFGSQAVEGWALAKGFQVVSVRRRSFAPHWRLLSSKRFQFFRVTIRDRAGGNRRAWMRIESDCTQPEVIDVIWDDNDSRA